MPGSPQEKKPIDEIENWNLDRSVDPYVMVRGIMTRTSAGNWVYAGSDAGQFRISSIGGSFSLSGDASGNRVSALQPDAGSLMVSGKSGDAALFRTSSIQQDAGLMRDSSIGGSLSLSGDAAGNRVSAVQADAVNLNISAKSSDAGTLLVSAKQGDAGLMRVSSIVDSGSISAKSGDANQLHVSSVQGDAALFRVSAIGGIAGDNVIVDGGDQSLSATIQRISGVMSAGANALAVYAQNRNDASQLRVSGFSDDGGLFRVSAKLADKYISATVDNGSVSAKSSDASTMLVSAKQGDAALLRVSSILDFGSVSAKSGDANQVHVSSVQGDAALLRVSAIGGTAGDNVLVDGGTQSISATVQRVSGVVSSGANGLVTYPQNRDDAVNLRISALSKDAGTFLVSARLTDKYISAYVDNGSLSAKSGDATNLNVSAKSLDAGTLLTSAKQGDAALLRMSGLSPDASTFRVSAIGGTAGDNVLVDGDVQTLSARIQRVSATVSGGDNALLTRSTNKDDAVDLRVSGLSKDGATFRVSAIVDSGSVSAKSPDAGTLLMSAKQGDAGLLRVSVLPATLTISAHEVKQSDAASLLTSAKSDSAGQLRTSAFSNDGGLLRVSSIQDGAAALNVSAKSSDAGTMRISARAFGDTTGSWTVFRSLSISASQNVKATAGAIYGYYTWNNDTKTNYLKFYNVSGTINLGTDIPILTKAIPASAAANMEFVGGLKGFTAGIGIAATSGVPDDNSAAPAASSVGINLFYV